MGPQQAQRFAQVEEVELSATRHRPERVELVHLWTEPDVTHLLCGLGIAAEIDERPDVEDEIATPNCLDATSNSVQGLEHHWRATRLLDSSRRAQARDARTHDCGPSLEGHRSTVPIYDLLLKNDLLISSRLEW